MAKLRRLTITLTAFNLILLAFGLVPLTVAVACAFLVTAGLFATWVPTRRVARTDPMTALRAE